MGTFACTDDGIVTNSFVRDVKTSENQHFPITKSTALNFKQTTSLIITEHYFAEIELGDVRPSDQCIRSGQPRGGQPLATIYTFIESDLIVGALYSLGNHITHKVLTLKTPCLRQVALELLSFSPPTSRSSVFL